MKKIVIVLVLVSYVFESVAAPKKPDCVKWTWNKNTVVCLKWRAQ